MTDTIVKLRLNQQQLELMDRTIAQGVAPDRAALVLHALREVRALADHEARAPGVRAEHPVSLGCREALVRRGAG